MKEPQTSQHFRWHVGMRIIKTVIAVFLCGLISHLQKQTSFYSMIAMVSAVICLQNSTGQTIASAVNRAIGTLIGGLAGVLVVYLMDAAGVLELTLIRYLILSLALIPLIQIALLIKRPTAASLVCVIFLCVTVAHNPGDTPALLALQRMIATLVGAATAYGVDFILPPRNPISPSQTAPDAQEATLDAAPDREEKAP